MAEIRWFKGGDGSLVTVSAENPLPVSGVGGMEPADILAELPAEITDNGDGTVTVSVNVGTSAGTVAAGNHNHSGVYAPVSHNHDSDYAAIAHDHDSDYAAVSHTHDAADVVSGTLDAARIPTLAQSKVSGLTTALADLDRVAANVGDADPTSLETVAASVDAIRDALVAAGLMASA